MTDLANRVGCTVTGTPGTGPVTLGAAISGYQTAADGFGANATVTVVFEDGAAWGVETGCAYDFATNTLARGVHESSSTGSALSLTSAAKVFVTLSAAELAAVLASIAGLGNASGLDVGTTAGTVAAGDDARLSDTRTPTAHAASHAAGQADEITPAAIGAATAAQGALADTALQPAGNGSALTGITAAQVGASPTGHAHTQAESHGSADTDTATTALHHTLGTGANQAAAGNHTHSGVYEPANANIQSHISSTSNPHGTTAAQVGAEPSGAVSTHAALSTTHTGLVSSQTHAATLKPVPVDADEVGLIDSAAAFGLKRLTWAALKTALNVRASNNDIGVPGQAGFGVGICPAIPPGYTELAGATDHAHNNYGNYQYSDGSIMCWVPAFYYRINDARNPTYAGYTTNSVDVQSYGAFADVATANAAGYALHRAFYDGGSIQPGFFIDKYQCSNNGGTASSIKNASPLSTHSTDHNPISALTGSPAANYGGCFAAAKTRGSSFFPAMRYQYAALALLALAHGQAATSNAWCAWYDAAGTNNFPKGCNNNALNDGNDSTVVYQSDGYSNCGKTGSATNFAKTTHNGQDSGVADLNGNMWEVSPGITCVSGTKIITGATQANPVALTVTGHGLSTGIIVMITSVGGMTQINDKLFAITVVDANTITLQGTDGTAFSAYTSGGTLTSGTFYALNTTATAKDLTGGNTLATDQWGATGVAAHSTAIVPTFRTDYAQNGFEKRFGKSTNQVLSAATSGDGWSLTGLGVPMASGISDGTTGTNLFGNDSMHQYICNELCLISGAGWGSGSAAGVWAASWYGARAGSSDGVGFRAASYL